MRDMKSESVAHGGLNSPYYAKRIGDYTGLAGPFDDGSHAANR